jgi:hypothetical protein
MSLHCGTNQRDKAIDVIDQTVLRLDDAATFWIRTPADEHKTKWMYLSDMPIHCIGNAFLFCILTVFALDLARGYSSGRLLEITLPST